MIIIVELVIALLLSLKQTKTFDLYLSYSLMVAFFHLNLPDIKLQRFYSLFL
ncbi:hypothetical protein [Myroides albus]|uniref:hypothetical protein n=1 Tax=Myroides albus TaxID=2562892 RepID=UPI003744294E